MARTRPGDLALAGSTLYGATSHGGSSYRSTNRGNGVVFKINTDGSGYTVLKNFTGSDGVEPWGRALGKPYALWDNGGGWEHGEGGGL